jgi:hypothetical protein
MTPAKIPPIRVYVVTAQTPLKALAKAVARDRRTRHRGDYRGRVVKRLRKAVNGKGHVWRVQFR